MINKTTYICLFLISGAILYHIIYGIFELRVTRIDLFDAIYWIAVGIGIEFIRRYRKNVL